MKSRRPKRSKNPELKRTKKTRGRGGKCSSTGPVEIALPSVVSSFLDRVVVVAVDALVCVIFGLMY